MKTRRLSLALLTTLILSFAITQADAPPKTTPPTANRADEPMADSFSLANAGNFLDAANLHWTRERKCGTCHTNYPYLMAGPSLPTASADSLKEVRSFFEDRAANWDTRKPRWDTEVVATASVLAFHDRQTTGKLHPISRQALDRMWTLQREDGSWNWLKCNWPPAEADDYYGVIIAAMGVGAAPDNYKETANAQAGLKKIHNYLSAHPAPSLHHQTMRLWAASFLTDLMSKEDRQSTATKLLQLQHADGGWCLPALGDWKRHSGEPNSADTAPSDAYATGLCVYVLRQSGLPADHEALRKGVHWLRAHQRQSGRWFTRSLSNDKHHYITHAGTAYAVMALKACGVEIPQSKK